MWLGITEYLYSNHALLEECIDTAIEDNTFRADDLEFTFAARVRSPHLLPLPSLSSINLFFPKYLTRL
jgi:hypothetical protein